MPAPDSQSDGLQRDETPASQPRARRAWRAPGAWITLILTLAIALGIDLGTKHWMFFSTGGLGPVTLPPAPATRDRDYFDEALGAHRHERIELLPWRLLDARLVFNLGAVFGIGQEKRLFFIGFTVVAIAIGVLLFARWTAADQHLAHVSIGLILAGGLGNLHDRIVIGAVRDFLHMLPETNLPFGWSWPGGSREVFPWVFNPADVMLLTGMALLMVHIQRLEHRRKRQTPPAENAEAPARPIGADPPSHAARSVTPDSASLPSSHR